MTEKPQTSPAEYVEDAEEILALNDLQYEDVVVPQWGNRKFKVRSLTGTERDRLELSMITVKRDKRGKILSRQQNLVGMRAKLVARSVVKADGSTPVFTEEQALRLSEKNAAAIQEIFLVAQKLSALSDDDIDELTAELGNDQSSAGGTG
jgi:hypothetical protein